MIRWIVESSVRLRLLIVIFAGVLLVYGIVQLRNMPVDVYPEFDPPLVEVQTEALGLSAAEIEALLTVPLEADLLNGVAWLDQIYSESVAGMSSILLVFEEDTDPIRARQMVQERLTQTFALPNVSSPPTMLQPLSTSSRVMMVGLSSESISLLELGVLARWNIKPRLMGVPGVANVAIWGHRDRQLQVLVDPERLQANGVSLQQIIETTGEALWVSPLSYLESSSPGTAGWIDTPNQRLTIRHELPISSADDLAQIPVAGTAYRLGDVANVVEDHQPLIGDAALRDGPGLLLVIEKFPGANTLDVTRGVDAALRAMAPGLEEVEIDGTIFRPANYIEQAIGNLRTAVLFGAVFLLLIFGLFFYNWRTALISLVSIPLSLVAAGYVLYLRGETFNSMMMAGLALALGVIIDNAVIDVDNLARHLRQRRQEGSDLSAVSIIIDAALQIRSSMVFALLIILLTVAPLFFIPGLAGAFLQPLITAYILALFASLAVTVIVTPALSIVLFAGAPLAPKESPIVERLRGKYSRFLARAIQAPRMAFIIAGVLIVLGLAALPFLDLSLVPTFKQTDLLIEWEAAPGTSRTEMNRLMNQVSQELQSITGVRNVGSLVGRAITGDAVVGINSGELWVSLDTAVDYETAVAAIQEVTNGYPGLFRTLQTYQPERTTEALTGTEHDLLVRIYGNDLDVLYEKAEHVRQSLMGIDGVTEVTPDQFAVEPQVEIEVDLAAAERFQIKPGDVRRQATTLLSGLRVGNLYEENKVFDVVVWGTPEVRYSLTDIENLLISTPRGGHVLLSELADIRIASSPIIIKRDVVSRYIDVAVNVSRRDIASVSTDIKASLLSIDFPLEYHAEVLGASAEQQTFRLRLIGIVIAAVLGSFLILQAAYNSWSLAFAAILTLPVALVGGVFLTLLTGGVLSLGSLFGFLTLLGIAVRNGIVLTTHLQYLQENEGVPFGSELVLQGVGDRFSPILMTILATGLVFLPLVIGGNIAGYEIVRPMAIVILGGLMTTAILDLFILPALYLQFGSSSIPLESERISEPAPGVVAGN
jgi:CzcA family heavy metal efflux pump